MFEAIDWDAPLDVAAQIESVPDDALIRGMFPAEVCRLARIAGRSIGRPSYIAFKHYPLREHMSLMAEAVPFLYPDVSLRRGLRALGAHAAPALRSSTFGRVMTSLLGTDPRRIIALAGKSYEVTRTRGSARVVDHVPGAAVVLELVDVHDWPDALHVGIYEAVIRELGQTWSARVKRITQAHIPLKLERAST
jgi:uncharacterized protein (TIGR02265 family)